MFSDAGPDVRWCGNEKGSAGDPNWSTVDPDAVPYPGCERCRRHRGAAARRSGRHACGGRPRPTRRSVPAGSITRPKTRACGRSTHLVDLYFKSVGRNSKLLLNVPPTRDGVLHDTDVSRLTGFAERRRRLFGVDLAEGRRLAWRRTGPTATVGDIDLGRSATVGIIRLEEDIAHGQVVARYTVSGANGGDWRVLSRGTTVGYARLDRIEPATVRTCACDRGRGRWSTATAAASLVCGWVMRVAVRSRQETRRSGGRSGRSNRRSGGQERSLDRRQLFLL